MSDELNKNENDVKDKEVLDKARFTKKSLLGYAFYVIIIICSLILRQYNVGAEIVLGDFGDITKAIFFVLAVTSLKWAPILSVVGMLLHYKRDRVKDISFLYMVMVSIVFIISLIILIIK